VYRALKFETVDSQLLVTRLYNFAAPETNYRSPFPCIWGRLLCSDWGNEKETER